MGSKVEVGGLSMFVPIIDERKRANSIHPQVDVSTRRADVIYTTTDEEENISLMEVIRDQSVAFSARQPHRVLDVNP